MPSFLRGLFCVIGVFDSGVGGLSVWREIARCLPGVPLVYLADQAHVPYGSRTLADVRALTLRCVRWLIEQRRCNVIVIACNTASGAALDAVRAAFPGTPIVGMEPAVKPAALNTKTGVVGVLATPVTFESSRYTDLIRKWANGVRVIEQPCAGWVEAVEAGRVTNNWLLNANQLLVANYMVPLLAVNADTLVLGCTHFPFLLAHIEQVIGEWRTAHPDAPPVTIIDPAPAVAQQVVRLWRSDRGNPSSLDHEFYTTGDVTCFEATTRTLVDVATHSTNVRQAFQKLDVPPQD